MAPQLRKFRGGKRREAVAAIECNLSEIAMPAVRTLNKVIATLLIGFFLSVPHAAFAQGLDEATLLQQKLLQLFNQGQYSEAVPLAERALAIRERVLGAGHPDVALSLYFLATLYTKQGRYADAEKMFKRSLTIVEQRFGPESPILTTPLNNLAELYAGQGRYAESEQLFKRSLAINEKRFGPDHVDIAASLSNLGSLYHDQGRYADAEPLYRRSLEILERARGPDHPDVATSLNNLATMYQDQGRYADAEPLYKRSLAIREKAQGPNHPDVAGSVNNLASLYKDQGRYSDSEPLYKRSLAINEKAFGSDHRDVALSLNNLATLYVLQRRFVDAEPLFKRSLAINESVLGPNHPDVAASLSNLASLYKDQGRYGEAELMSKRALDIREKALGLDHTLVAATLNNLATIYDDQGRYPDALQLYQRALAIDEKAFGANHPYVANSLSNLAGIYRTQKRYANSETFYKRSLAIEENALGGDHPNVAMTLNNLAALYAEQGRYDDAEQLYKRALAIDEKAFGPENPDVALLLNNLADLYRAQRRYADALRIVRRTIAQNNANKSVAIAVLHASQSQNLIPQAEAVKSSYIVLQRSSSSPAADALSKLNARLAAGHDQLAHSRKDQDLTAEADRLDKIIVAAVSRSPAERSAVMENETRKRINEIKLDRDRLQDVFNQRFPDYVALSRPQPLTIEQTQALLADDEALVVIDLDKSSYVWVVTREWADWKELLASADDVSKLVGFLRSGLNPDASKQFDRNRAYQLYRQVLGPIEELISQKRRLSLVLDGALTSLPLQLLITSDPDRKDLASVDWLVRKFAVTVLPSVASLKILRGEQSTVAAIKPMIGFGDPIFDRTVQTAGEPKVTAFNRSLTSFYRGVTADTNALAKALPALPETADELRAIGKILGAGPEDIKLGEAASVTNVKHTLLANYRVVYFATHALVAGEVEKFAKVKAEPALVLSIPDKPTDEDDGLLTASEVAMLKLNADFVVLSACNTAAGDKPGAEALSGLARAFFYAGAKSLVVSHWEVDSEATVALMDGLFEALKANPHLSHAEALRMSTLRMIANSSKPEWAQPEFWAPFVVVGEPQKR